MAKNKRVFLFAGVGFVILMAAVIIAVLNTQQVLSIFGISSKAPVFVFNQSAAPGWWNADNYNNQASADPKDKNSEPINTLSVARMNIFKGTKGDGATACFVMFAYYNHPADASTLHNPHKPGSTANITVQSLKDTTAFINTPSGTKSYVIHNYATSGPGSENSMKGTSYALVDLGNGYITVDGVCPTGGELEGVTSAMGAVSLVK